MPRHVQRGRVRRNSQHPLCLRMQALDPPLGDGSECHLGRPRQQTGHVLQSPRPLREQPHLSTCQAQRVQQLCGQTVVICLRRADRVKSQASLGTCNGNRPLVVANGEQAPRELFPKRQAHLKKHACVLPRMREIREDNCATGC